MSPALSYSVSALVAYLAGSIPCSLLLAKYGKGIDLRQHGSGNVGATNVARTMGWGWGSLALALDALKGLLATLYVPDLISMASESRTHQMVLCGLMAIIGHTFPVWLKFKGGKGVATALGVATVLSWKAILIACAVFIAVFAVRRIVSLASILAVSSFTLAVLYMTWPTPFTAQGWSLSAFAIAAPGLIVLRHASNIGRLLRGEEKALRVETPASK